MNPAQITAELPRLTHAERRELMRQLLALEEDPQTLEDCDRRADANFQMLDALEAKDDARPAH